MDDLEGFASVVVDCDSDPAALARWWQGLIGGEIELDEDDDEVASWYCPGFPPVDFVRVPDAKTVKNRLHLDLRATDFDKAVEEAVVHGATRADDVYDGGRWQVLRDPAGNEFCILRPRPSS